MFFLRQDLILLEKSKSDKYDLKYLVETVSGVTNMHNTPS